MTWHTHRSVVYVQQVSTRVPLGHLHARIAHRTPAARAPAALQKLVARATLDFTGLMVNLLARHAQRIPTHPFQAQSSLPVSATSGIQDRTEARARCASPEPSKASLAPPRAPIAPRGHTRQRQERPLAWRVLRTRALCAMDALQFVNAHAIISSSPNHIMVRMEEHVQVVRRIQEHHAMEQPVRVTEQLTEQLGATCHALHVLT